MKLGLHIFRKDLRIKDNTALIELSAKVDKVIGLFVFDPYQIDKNSNNYYYYSEHAAQFVIDSVHDLYIQTNKNLIVAYDDPIKVIESITKQYNLVCVSFNADYTPYSLKRDQKIVDVCEKYSVECNISYSDHTLLPMDVMLKSNREPYLVFGPFYKLLIKQDIKKPEFKSINWYKIKSYSDHTLFESKLIDNIWIGGRKEALRKLSKANKTGSTDTLTIQTTELSAYLNQGCLSVREVFHSFEKKFGKSSDQVRSLVWRDFFACIYKFANNANNYYKHIDDRYDQIKFPKVNKDEWTKFMNCSTGFVLVDACMNELLSTGYINNRARLILATFWTKLLLINPLDKKYGSQVWFSRLLIDCSASQNKLNHQWIIGDLDLSGRRYKMKNTHALTGRVIRIDNDLIKKYDPTFEYIKQWNPLFKDLAVVECKKKVKQIKPIFNWKDRYLEYNKLFKHIQ